KPNYADATLRVRVPLTGPVVVRLVRFGSITGHVTDRQNQPMREVNVFPMAGEANGQFRPLPTSAQTDDTGQYRLYNLAPGPYAVAVSWATMNPGATFGGAYLFPNNQRPEVFSIVSGASLRGIDFVQPAQSEYSVSGRLQIPDRGK